MKKSNTKLLYTLIIIFAFIQTFSHGFYSYYFLNVKKIDFNVFTFSKSIWFLTVILLEIPSGYLSDKWSKKNIFIFSNLLMVLSFIFYSIAGRTNNNFLIGEIFSASSNALSSGTLDALLFNQIAKKEVFKNIEISQTVVQMINVGLGIYVSTLLGSKIWYLPFFVTLVVVFLALFIEEPKDETNKKTFFEDVSNIYKLFKNKQLIFWVVTNVFIFALAQRVFNYWQSYISIVSKNIWVVPFLSMLIFFFQYLGNLFSTKVNTIKKQMVCLFIICIIMILAIFKNPLITLFAIYAVQFLRGSIIPGMSFQINSKIPNDYRSTFLSISSLMRSFGSYIMMSVFIPLIGNKNINTMLINSTWIGGYLFIAIVIMYFSLIVRNKNK